MMKCIVNLLRRLLPIKIYKWFHDIYKWPCSKKEGLLISQCKREHKKQLKLLSNKKTIRCVFFALFEEIWKYDYVYKIMEENPRFEASILVCPIVNYGHDNMVDRMEKCYNAFKRIGYNVIKAYKGANHYVDVMRELKPDIIFYTNPYRGLIDDRYFITNFSNVLTAYVPYYFGEGIGYQDAYNSLFCNLLWRRYVETDDHKSYAQKYARTKGRNVVITGYPGIEKLLDKSYVPSDSCWKNNAPKFKRVIWAPHHTMEAAGKCHYSCFLNYCDFMIELASKYNSQLQFVFKPHPLLRNKLNLLWGEEKTSEYYKKWASMDNACLNEGDYVDLFLTSDAMIHDSGSFIAEYLYTNKPVMRTLNNVPLEEMYNPFALKCLENYYMARNEQDIEQFIQNVINGVDPLKEQRTKFVNEVLMPKGSPSQNIINDILDSIDNQILYPN